MDESTGLTIIAEIGVNHDGSLEKAIQLVDYAKQAGADIAKFQVFEAEQLATSKAETAAYQRKRLHSDLSQIEMLRSLELQHKDFIVILDYCIDVGIEFMASGFSPADVDFIASLGVKRLKVPSGEITNLPYLREVGKTGLPVLLSTGMSELSEVAAAVGELERLRNHRSGLTILHCTSDYPAELIDVNLRAMETLRSKFSLPVGYSDHTEGIEVAIAATALGASFIEKHLTIDKNSVGPDHRASLNPSEFRQMVSACRRVELAMGSPEKSPVPGELDTRRVARKSIVASNFIRAGEIFSEKNLTTKRPGDGTSPMEWDRVIGQSSKRDFLKDEQIEL